MRKLITKHETIELKHRFRLYPEDISANDIRIEGDKDVVLFDLNLNIVKYDINDDGGSVEFFIINSSINKLVLNGYNKRGIRIMGSNIQDIYVQSEIGVLSLVNTPIPNFHGRVDLINEIKIEQ